MRKSRLNTHLEHLNEDELRSEIVLLYDKVPGVKAYYTMELGSEDERKRIYDRAKKQIRAKYVTKSYRKPRRPRIQKINSILSEMAQKSVFTHELIDLYLFDVEMAVQFMREYHFFSEVLANHITTVFTKAVDLAGQLRLEGEWRVRCQNVIATCRFSRGIQMDLEDSFRHAFNQ